MTTPPKRDMPSPLPPNQPAGQPPVGSPPQRPRTPLVVIAVTAALALASVFGCTNTSSTRGSTSNSTSASAHPSSPAGSSNAGGSTTPSYTPGSGNGSYSMTLNSQNIGQGSEVKCVPSTSRIGISYGKNEEGHSGRFGITNPSSNPQLDSATISVFDPTAQRPDNRGLGFIVTWEYESSHNGFTGTPTVTVNGKSFKITGKLSAKGNAQRTEPFEFDATCP